MCIPQASLVDQLKERYKLFFTLTIKSAINIRLFALLQLSHLLVVSTTLSIGCSKIMGKWSFVSAVPSFLLHLLLFSMYDDHQIWYSLSLFSSCWCSGKINIGIKMKIVGKKSYITLYLNFLSHTTLPINTTWWYEVWFIQVSYSLVDN
jgi:hypothetical protein